MMRTYGSGVFQLGGTETYSVPGPVSMAWLGEAVEGGPPDAEMTLWNACDYFDKIMAHRGRVLVPEAPDPFVGSPARWLEARTGHFSFAVRSSRPASPVRSLWTSTLPMLATFKPAAGLERFLVMGVNPGERLPGEYLPPHLRDANAPPPATRWGPFVFAAGGLAPGRDAEGLPVQWTSYGLYVADEERYAALLAPVLAAEEERKAAEEAQVRKERARREAARKRRLGKHAPLTREDLVEMTRRVAEAAGFESAPKAGQLWTAVALAICHGARRTMNKRLYPYCPRWFSHRERTLRMVAAMARRANLPDPDKVATQLDRRMQVASNRGPSVISMYAKTPQENSHG
jgi:hypothetical protein